MRLSIIIPTYNRAQRLFECLESILITNFDDLEILVSDNASSDDTFKVLSNVKDGRLNWWSNESNIGPNANINLLLERSKGEYVLALTDDSTLSKDAIPELLAILDAYPKVGFVMSRMAYQHEQTGKIVGYRQELEQSTYFPPGNTGLESLWMGTGVFPRLVIRRDLIDLAGARKHVLCGYCHMYVAGQAIKGGGAYYLDKILVINWAANKNHWEYPLDLWLPGRLAILRDLLPNPGDFCAQQYLVKHLLTQEMDLAMSRSHGRIFSKLLQYPEVRREPIFWIFSLRWAALLPYRLPKHYFLKIAQSTFPRNSK